MTFIYQHKRENHTGKNTRKAREIATRVLGKSLGSNVEIHHVDGDPSNNKHSNLVICEDRSYHKILHARTTALLACGNVNWKRCNLCEKWDCLKNLTIAGRGFQHKQCTAEYARIYRKFCLEGKDTSLALEVFRGGYKVKSNRLKIGELWLLKKLVTSYLFTDVFISKIFRISPKHVGRIRKSGEAFS